MRLYQRARASNGLHAAKTSLSVLTRWAALNELTLTALIAGITSSLFQMSAPSNELIILVSNYTLKGLGPHATIYQTTSGEMST